jgi:predicted regulator of Ras-like GTPase activity (Roadblock/LC7/MglB family)
MVHEAEVRDELGRLRSRMPDVTGLLAATVDGMVVAEDAPTIEPEGFAALTAAALGVALRLTDAAGQHTFREQLIRTGHGYIVTYAAGDRFVLTVLAGPRINVGRLHLEARRCGAALAQLLDGAADRTEDARPS